MATTRLFVALWPDKRTRDAIAQVQKQVMTATGMLNNAVAYENLHMTLQFLGNTPGNHIDKIILSLQNIRSQPFSVCLDRWGQFPKPGILWIGPTQVSSQLTQLHNEVVSRLHQYGSNGAEKTWQPHVSLFRKVNYLPVVDTFEPVAWAIDRLVLVQSNTHSTGVKYTVLWQGDL